jgi:hypothetical protein
MANYERSQSTNPAFNRPKRAYIVYDPSNGEVLHTHYSIDSPTGVPVREEAAQRAKRFVGKAHSSDVLEVEPSKIPRNKRFKIDAKARKLVVIEDSQ